MQVKIHSIHFDADSKLIEFVEQRVDRLNQFFDNIVSAEVYLRLDKDGSRENKVAELKVLLPGKELFAKKQSASFEAAMDDSVEAVKKQVIKYKGKLNVV